MIGGSAAAAGDASAATGFVENFAADEGAYSIAMGEAHGANILSATLTSALTVENQVSFVLGMAL